MDGLSTVEFLGLHHLQILIILLFILSDWDFLFTKEIPDDAIDESDTLLNDAISVALSIGNENSFEEDMDSDMLDEDLDVEYIEEE